MPAKVRGSRGSGRDSGTNTLEPFATWDPITSSWKTSALSLLEDSTPFSGRWPISGTMRNGVCTAQPTWAPRTDAIESGFWPTATAGDGASSGSGTTHIGQPLTEAARGWTTPTVDDANNVVRSSGQQKSLARDTTQWSTPRAEDGERGQASQHDGLMEDARDWATPSTRDWKDSPGMATTGINPDGSERSRLDQLPRQAVAWTTPQAHDVAMGDPARIGRHGTKHGGRDLTDEAAAFAVGQMPSPSEATTAPSDSSPVKPRRRGLNPRFGLWLMGFPVAWLDCVESATRSSRRVRSRSSDALPNSSEE